MNNVRAISLQMTILSVALCHSEGNSSSNENVTAMLRKCLCISVYLHIQCANGARGVAVRL